MYIVMHTPHRSGKHANCTVVHYCTARNWEFRLLLPCARTYAHALIWWKPWDERGMPPPFRLAYLLQLHHVVSSLTQKKRKKKTWIGVDEGRRHPSAGSRRIAERGKDRKLEREAERERKTFLPIWSRHSFSHSSAIDPSSDPVQPTSSTAR